MPSPALPGDDAHPRRLDGLAITPVEDGFTIYQAERDRLHYLNATGVLVLELCNGRNSADDIATLIREAYDLPESPSAEVRDVVDRLQDEGLIA